MPTHSETVGHGRYIIQIALFGDHWQGQAYRNRRPVSERFTEKTREALVELFKSKLDARDEEERASRDASGAPSVEAYGEALRALGRLPEGHQAMLDAHLAAPDHVITATQLAEAAGYQSYSAANLQYGTLGCRLAEELDWHPPRRKDGSPIWTYALATDAADAGSDAHPDDEQVDDARESSPEFQWRMRPQVVEALRNLTT